MSDLHFALRRLWKSPGFAATVLLTLALCIGANSAIFSVINAVLLRPLPFPEPDRLVTVNNSYPRANLARAGVSIPDYLDRVARAPSIESAALITWESLNLGGGDQPTRVMAVRATPSLFPMLGATPELGRVFTAAEAQPGNNPVVVLGHALWKDHFGGRTNLVGESIRLHGVSHTVLGVMPAGFEFPQPEVKLWVPFAFTPEQRSDRERGHEFSDMYVRLRPGATPQRLEDECATIIRQNLESLPEARTWVESSGFTTAVTPVLEETVGGLRRMLWLVQAGVVAALLIGCANVGNLMLTRVMSQQRELAIRSALGAGQWRLVRQIGFESLILFVAGGLLGWGVARWGLSAAEVFGVTGLPRAESVRLDGRVLAFTFATVGLTALTFGLLPAWHGARADAAEALRQGGGRLSTGHSQLRLRQALVVSEVALAVALLATAGLLRRSFDRLQRQSPGFDAESVLTARLTLPEVKYPQDGQRLEFADRLVSALRALPGVTRVGFTDSVPFGHNNSQATYDIIGHESPAGQPPPHGLIRSVSEDYFESLRIPLLRGRGFRSSDSPESEQVVVIDRVLSDRYFPGRDPIGQKLRLGGAASGAQRTIVGVVAPVKHRGLDDATPKETIYFPYRQRPVESFTLVLRAARAPKDLIPAVRRTLRSLDPEQPVYDVQTLEARIRGSLRNHQVPMRLLSLFGGMALLLASLGVYGILAFHVGQRTQEFGIRGALGAGSRDIATLVLRQGMRLVLPGIALGMVGYLALGRVLRTLVFEISPWDPQAMLFGPLILCALAVLACWLPARRASRVDPMTALRAG
ncbi:MAG: ABC transporter permease [Verrucomicrobiales bacterium]|nr:ABC transporter permease [Verrucomicrobiales bacterium]